MRTQVGEEMVAQTSDEVQGLSQESVEEVWAVEWRGRREQVGYGEHCCVLASMFLCFKGLSLTLLLLLLLGGAGCVFSYRQLCE